MAKVNVSVDGFGRFQIESDFVAELISWLSQKQAVSIRDNNTVREVSNNNFTGRELLNG
jgi:hypothetical protein